jgi:predicted Fe-Mo cluster-binding NifX family protein
VTTCIAIALFGDEVSPRFCFADRILVVNLARGQEVWRHVVSLGEPWLPQRMSQLAALGVRTLLCGAFNRAYLPAAERLGVQVVTGIRGNAEDALTLFKKGATQSPRPRRRRPCCRS